MKFITIFLKSKSVISFLSTHFVSPLIIWKKREEEKEKEEEEGKNEEKRMKLTLIENAR